MSAKQGIEIPDVHCRWHSLERCSASEEALTERKHRLFRVSQEKPASFDRASPQGSLCYSSDRCPENLDLGVTGFSRLGPAQELSQFCLELKMGHCSEDGQTVGSFSRLRFLQVCKWFLMYNKLICLYCFMNMNKFVLQLVRGLLGFGNINPTSLRCLDD